MDPCLFFCNNASSELRRRLGERTRSRPSLILLSACCLCLSKNTRGHQFLRNTLNEIIDYRMSQFTFIFWKTRGLSSRHSQCSDTSMHKDVDAHHAVCCIILQKSAGPYLYVSHLHRVNHGLCFLLRWRSAQLIPLTPQCLQVKGASIRQVSVFLPERNCLSGPHALTLQLLHRVLPPEHNTWMLYDESGLSEIIWLSPCTCFYWHSQNEKVDCEYLRATECKEITILKPNHQVWRWICFTFVPILGYWPFPLPTHVVIQRLCCPKVKSLNETLIGFVHRRPNMVCFSGLLQELLCT